MRVARAASSSTQRGDYNNVRQKVCDLESYAPFVIANARFMLDNAASL